MKTGKQEKGVIIVEATFIIPMFIFLIITIMWVVNLCTAQAKIQMAINSAAKEISTYSYLYGLTGLNNKRAEMNESGSMATGSIDDAIDGVSKIYSGLSSASDSGQQAVNGDFSGAKDSLEQGKSEIQSGGDSLKGVYEKIKKDPKGFLISLANATGSVAIDSATGYVAGGMGKYFSEKHLETAKLSADEHMRKLGVVGGFDGIDFSHSRYCTGGSDDIIIVAEYQLKPIQFFKIDVKYNIVQTGRTKAWFGVSNKTDSDGDGE